MTIKKIFAYLVYPWNFGTLRSRCYLLGPQDSESAVYGKHKTRNIMAPNWDHHSRMVFLFCKLQLFIFTASVLFL